MSIEENSRIKMQTFLMITAPATITDHPLAAPAIRVDAATAAETTKL
jgi:hypothetical protein